MAFNGGLIAVIAGAAIGGLALSRRTSAAAPSSSTTSGGGTVCDALPAGAQEQCRAALGVVGGFKQLIDAIGNANDKSAKAVAAETTFDAQNKALNGEVRVANDIQNQPGMTQKLPWWGSVLEFANGCQPFKGAPGWSKCKPGTHDMRESALDPRAAPNPTTRAAARDYATHNPDVALPWSAFLTGSVDPKRPDPTTRGPSHTASGELYFVRGRKVVCPAGQAPALWNSDGTPSRDQRTTTTCAPGGVAAAPTGGYVAPGPVVPVVQPGTFTSTSTSTPTSGGRVSGGITVGVLGK